MIASAARVAALATVVGLGSVSALEQPPQSFAQRPPDFERMLQQQAETDKTWRAAADGTMQMEKIVYRSRVGDLDIPAFVFQPLKPRGAKGHPALFHISTSFRCS